ncbi:MAG TPA: hypothetical protein PKA82_17320, partial [Pyrinomonadaceae bacterium]|nr:hypothetical protein [Pyrinomonadaceae bacterium]
MSEQADNAIENRVKAVELAEIPRRKTLAAIRKAERLLKNLASDVAKHGDADRWRKFGELLLANLSNARREGDLIIVKDLYADGEPEVSIDG